MRDTLEIERLSKLLFGSKYRLPVAAAIATARDNRLFVHAIAEQLGIADNLVSGEVRRFHEAGLLVPVTEPGQTRTLYRRQASPYWQLTLELLREADGIRRPSVEELLEQGESETLEFRAAALANVGAWLQGGPLPDEQPSAAEPLLRTIVALLNSKGGTVLIGVVEDGSHSQDASTTSRLAEFPSAGNWAIVGLRDPTFLERGWDAWKERVYHLIQTRIAPVPLHLIAMRAETIEDQPVALIEVQASAEGFFLKDARGDHRFYVRFYAEDRQLVGPEMTRYWSRSVDLLTVPHHGSQTHRAPGPRPRSSA